MSLSFVGVHVGRHPQGLPSSVAEPVRASESASRSVTETDSPSKAEALICMLYRSSVPADCCTSPGIEPPKAPKCSFVTPPGGTEKSVLQTPCEGVPRKVHSRCRPTYTKLEAVPSLYRQPKE